MCRGPVEVVGDETGLGREALNQQRDGGKEECSLVKCGMQQKQPAAMGGRVRWGHNGGESNESRIDNR